MFFWFVATAIFGVGFVFRDPRFDYRLLVVGSVLPLVDGAFGGARVLHAVTVSIALLVVVMLATSGRRPIRKVMLGLPIGMFMHLVFDAAWTDTDVFWWPFTGLGFSDAGLPAAGRGFVGVVLEVLGVVGCAWLWRNNGLGSVERRRRLLADGRLDVVPDRVA